ncbi:GspH/FimT family pseudopilin [Desulfobulbus sp. F4]|nr:GspH/FimT family pseudopilin [Desulfobulbus sp. F4]
MKRLTEPSFGFTTVELAIVMAIVAILSAIALPGILKGVPEKRLRGAARNLYSDMQKARLLAVKYNTTVTVNFDKTNGTYTYCNQFDYCNSSTTAPPCNKTPPLKLTCIDSKIVTLEKGVSYGIGSAGKNNSSDCDWKKDKCSEANTIEFTYRGTASSDGSAYLQNDAKDVCYAVSANSYGYVRIRRFNGSKWED